MSATAGEARADPPPRMAAALDHLNRAVDHATLEPEGIAGFLEALPIDRCGEVRLADSNGEYEEHLPPGEGMSDWQIFVANHKSFSHTLDIPRVAYENFCENREDL